MTADDPRGSVWSASEIDLIVAVYFQMLDAELARHPYVKRQHNTAVQEVTKRSPGSIERKFQNVSAVLDELGLPWINGYKPLRNYQDALIDGVEKFLASRGSLTLPQHSPAHGLTDLPGLFLEAPPVLQVARDPRPPALERLVRKFDPAERDARNRTLGDQGEERVFHFERNRLTEAGRSDLARKVRWVAKEDGDGAGYDIRSFESSGTERLLEVKTTIGHRTTPFFLTERERLVSTERPDAFRLVRLYDFARLAKAFELVPPLADSIILRATNYRASFS